MERSRSIPFSHKLTAALLFIIVVIGSVMRFIHLGSQSLWSDEFATLFYSTAGSWLDVLRNAARIETFPPLYYLIIHLTVRIFGDTAFWLRFPSALAGILSIPALYALGEALFTRREGLIAAAFLAVLPTPIYFSQEARPYALVVLFSILSALFLTLWLKRILAGLPAVAWGLAFAATIAFLLYLHYYPILLFAVEGLVALVIYLRAVHRPPLFSYCWPFILPLLLYLPWIPAFIHQLDNQTTGLAWLPRPSAAWPVDFFDFTFTLSVNIRLVLLFILSFGSGACVMQLIRSKDPSDRQGAWIYTGLAAWLIIPLLIPYLVSILYKPVLYNRYVVFVLPAAYLLVARSLLVFPYQKNLVFAAGVVLAAYLGYSTVWKLDFYTQPNREQIREVVERILADPATRDGSVIVGCIWNPLEIDYYLELNGSHLRMAGIICDPSDVDQLPGLLGAQQSQDFWFVESQIRQTNPGALEEIDRRYQRLGEDQFYLINLYHYQEK